MMQMDLRPNLKANPFEKADAAANDGTLIQTTLEGIGLIPDATTTGNAAVELLFTADNGQVVVAHTTLALFATAARAILAAPIAVAEGYDPRTTWSGQ